MTGVTHTLRALRDASRRVGGERRRRLERANEHFGWLALLDLRGWSETPRDRLIDQTRARRAARRGHYALDRWFRPRRPGRGPLPAGPPQPLRVLFVMRHYGYVRQFEHPLRALAEAGHEIELLLGPTRKGEDSRSGVVARLLAAHPGITATTVALGAGDRWAVVGTRIRDARDYLRYLEPPLDDSEKLRARARSGAPQWTRRFADSPFGRSRHARRALDRALEALAAAVPPGADVRALLAERRPDLVLVTPLVFAARQAEFVRAARELGIPSVHCVSSWDNLTTKGLVHEVADLTTVWNGTQVEEAVAMHGVPRERVVATGAQCYDHWFGWRPARDRAAFCREVGLPDDRPFLLYMCSSGFIAGDEAGTVADWIGALRARPEPELADVGVLVRPHPANVGAWAGVDAGAEFGPGVAVWPVHDAEPDNDAARADYFDSIHHATAVVGVNTSAMIESAIVGRPVLSLLQARYADTQARSVHFSYLNTAGGGLVRPAADAEAHARDLRAVLAGDWNGDGRREEFLRAFIRPHGLDADATPRMVGAWLRTAAGPVPRPRRVRGEAALRLALRIPAARARPGSARGKKGAAR